MKMITLIALILFIASGVTLAVRLNQARNPDPQLGDVWIYDALERMEDEDGEKGRPFFMQMKITNVDKYWVSGDSVFVDATGASEIRPRKEKISKLHAQWFLHTRASQP